MKNRITFPSLILCCIFLGVFLSPSPLMSAKPEREEDAIPQNCIIDVVGWFSESPKEKYPGQFTVSGGRVTMKWEETSPGWSRKGTSQDAVRHTGVFKGRLDGNVIRGTMKQVMHPFHYRYSESYGQGTCTIERKGSWTKNQVCILHPDGRLTSSERYSGLWQERIISGTCRNRTVQTKPQSGTNKGKGTWRIRMQEGKVVPPSSVSGTTEEANIEAEEKAKAEERVRIEAEEKRKAEEEARTRNEAKVRAEADEKAKADAEAQAKAEEAKIKEDAEEKARVEAEKEAKAEEEREAGKSLPPWVPAAAGAAAGATAATGALLMMAASGVKPKEVWDSMKDLMSQGPASEPEVVEEYPPEEEHEEPSPEPEGFWPEEQHRDGQANEYDEVWSEMDGGWVSRNHYDYWADSRKDWMKLREENWELNRQQTPEIKRMQEEATIQNQKLRYLQNMRSTAWQHGFLKDAEAGDVYGELDNMIDGIIHEGKEPDLEKAGKIRNIIWRKVQEDASDGPYRYSLKETVDQAAADTSREIFTGVNPDGKTSYKSMFLRGMMGVATVGKSEYAYEVAEKMYIVKDAVDRGASYYEAVNEAAKAVVLDEMMGRGMEKGMGKVMDGVDTVKRPPDWGPPHGIKDTPKVLDSVGGGAPPRKPPDLPMGVKKLSPLTDPELIAKKKTMIEALDSKDTKKIVALYEKGGMKKLADLEKQGHITPKQAQDLNNTITREVNETVDTGTKTSISSFQKEHNVKINEVLVGDSGSSARAGGAPRSVKTDADRTLVPDFDEDTVKKYAHKENISVEEAHDRLCQKFQETHTKEINSQLNKRGLNLEDVDYKNYDRIAPKTTTPDLWDDKARALKTPGQLPKDDIYTSGYTNARQSVQGQATSYKVDPSDGTVRTYKASGDTLLDQNQLLKAKYEGADISGLDPQKIDVKEMGPILKQQKNAALDASDPKSLAKAVNRSDYVEQRLTSFEHHKGVTSPLKGSLDPKLKQISKEMVNNPQDMQGVLNKHGLSSEQFVKMAKDGIESL